ncbi:hypothetical protein BDP27DRAFT_1414324 [Rhodocollybia butyracea]|uniref:Uncharacterized protein n=1 Tax=Rhodocollybia butyracea TaxID=206335 RepID=A0A9P5Q866_9AGAR|nr:hypothetical protein BDP27DRAFT_1414324 [Rhodocollybia butyracea]
MSLSPLTPRQQIFTAIQSNTNHQYALEKYTQRLTAELQEIDRLLAAADIGDSDDEIGDIEIRGAVRATGPIPESEFLNPISPFYHDAIKRDRYLNFTTAHHMKPKELEALTDAVTAETRRLRALERNERGVNAQDPVDLTVDVMKLNWKTIAEKVSDVSSFNRTDEECKTRWLGYERPGINRDEWTSDELKKLKEIVAEKEADEEYELDWVEISQELGTNRTPIDCMRNGFIRERHSWSPESDAKLVDGIQVYGLENWALVALHVSPHVTPNQCLMRYNRSLNPLLRKSPWNATEDDRLDKVVSALGTSNWTEVAKHLPGRTNEMCRERYVERSKSKADPRTKSKGKGKAKAISDEEPVQEKDGEGTSQATTKESWTEEQDSLLVKMVGEIGNKWLQISEAIGMHTNNQCRQRYNKLKNQTNIQTPSSSSNLTFKPFLVLAPHLTPSDTHATTSGQTSTSPAPTSASGLAVTLAKAPAKPRPKPKPRTKATLSLHAQPQATVNSVSTASSFSEPIAQDLQSLEPDIAEASTFPSGLSAADKGPDTGEAHTTVMKAAKTRTRRKPRATYAQLPLRRSTRRSQALGTQDLISLNLDDSGVGSASAAGNGTGATSDSVSGAGGARASPARTNTRSRKRTPEEANDSTSFDLINSETNTPGAETTTISASDPNVPETSSSMPVQKGRRAARKSAAGEGVGAETPEENLPKSVLRIS